MQRGGGQTSVPTPVDQATLAISFSTQDMSCTAIIQKLATYCFVSLKNDKINLQMKVCGRIWSKYHHYSQSDLISKLN